MKVQKDPEQIAKEQARITFLRRSINERVNRVPSSFNAWSYQRAVDFKEAVVKALKVAKAARPKLPDMEQAHSRLLEFYA